ncbi:MAG: alcohol dehydrogenase [Rhodobiaceae bacterium]|nr:alcohol dehydrogenase [Rhodobiaceae bacterium]
MKALTSHGKGDIRYEDYADPTCHADTDMIVQMKACGICGSDLHIYHGAQFTGDTGFCVGHEAIGEVAETGRGVKRFKPGDKVMISAAVGCGNCRACLGGHINRCENNQMGCYGLGHALEGCQAEGIRVPMGDYNARFIPDGVSDDQALLLTDNLPTAYLGCLNADIGPGKRVAIVGLGPIGLMAVEIAKVMGAAEVYALDFVAERRERAKALGAIPVDPAQAKALITEATKGRMLDCAVEAVGADASIRSAIDIVGAQGTVSVIGVNQSMDFKFPMGLAFIKGLTFRISACSVQSHWDELIALVQGGRLHPESVITHRMGLKDGAEAYRLFDTKEDGALKMVMQA